MRSSATTEVVPFFRTDAQLTLLHAVLSSEGRAVIAHRVAVESGLHPNVVSREMHRLVRAGMLETTRVGRNLELRGRFEHPAWPAVTQLVMLAVGPLVELSELYELDGVEQVYIFGSWARRHLGDPGPYPGDIDVAVVGEVDELELALRAAAVGGRVGLQTSAMAVPAQGWEQPDPGSALEEIKGGPLVEVPRG